MSNAEAKGGVHLPLAFLAVVHSELGEVVVGDGSEVVRLEDVVHTVVVVVLDTVLGLTLAFFSGGGRFSSGAWPLDNLKY